MKYMIGSESKINSNTSGDKTFTIYFNRLRTEQQIDHQWSI